MILQIIAIIILLMLSAYFSSAETALTTVNPHSMRAMAEDGNKKAAIVLKLIENPSQMLSSVLVGNNLVNISLTSLTTTIAIRIFGSMGAGIATAVITVLVLIFGEITPKTFATINNTKLALSYASSIYLITKLLTPVVYIINKLSTAILIILRIDSKQSKRIMTERELRTIVDVSHEEGILESEERKMITNIVDFGDSIAKDVMISRLDICMVEVNTSYDDLLSEFTEHKFARMPVYDDTIDNIVGIINLKDFVFYNGDKEKFNLRDLIREAHITYEYKNVSELFMEMRRDSIPMTIVLDEYGALSGLITMEDLLEEIVGEIRDEYDEDEEDEIQQVTDNEYIVLGSTSLDDIEERIGLPLEAEEYDSISGHVINLLEHFPNPGEHAEDDYAVYTVLESEKNRIDKIHLLVKPQPDEDDED